MTLHPLYEALGWLLAFFYSLIPNYGVAIILLTVAVRLVLFPLTAKQAKSMLAMQQAAPEIKKLQAKFKDDRQKLNEEMMRFYKENKINPFGGCLPLLAQAPIFWALYRVLENITKYIPINSQMLLDLCGHHVRCHNPNIPFLGMDLSQRALHLGKVSFAAALPYYVLIGLVVATSFVQMKQTMRYQTQVTAQNKMMAWMMPVVFAFISLSIPAGVVLYFLVSNIWQIGQQELVYKTVGTPLGPAGGKSAIEAKGTERPPSKGPVSKGPASTPPTPAAPAGGLSRLFRPSAGNGAGAQGDGPEAISGDRSSASGDGGDGPPTPGASAPARPEGSRPSAPPRASAPSRASQGRKRSNKKKRR